MKIRKTFTLSAILTGIAIVSILLTILRYYSAEQRYKRNQDGTTLEYILSTKVSPGDSLDKVIALIGPGRRFPDGYVEKMLQWQAGPQFSPTAYPDGIEKDDVFIGYNAKPGPGYPLQFRDGQIVNFAPNDYIGPDDTFAEANAQASADEPADARETSAPSQLKLNSTPRSP